jgi:hypothetical protein
METTRPQPGKKCPFESPGYTGQTTLWTYKYLLEANKHVEWDPEIQDWLMTEEGRLHISETKAKINKYRLKGFPTLLKETPLLPIPYETLSACKCALRIRIIDLWSRRKKEAAIKSAIYQEIRENVRALRNLRQTFTAYALPHFNETLRHWPLSNPLDNPTTANPPQEAS